MNREVKTMELFSYAVLLLVLTAKLCSAGEGKELLFGSCSSKIILIRTV